MKSSLTYLKNHLVCFGAAALLLLSVSAAQAQVLLTINITNPDAVTITASGTYTGSEIDSNLNNGIDLLSFFTADAGTSPITINGASSLTTGVTVADGAVFDTVYPDELTVSPLNYTDLSLYSSDTSAGANETFLNGTSGFSGTITLNLSGYSLQPVGTIKNIVVGSSFTDPSVSGATVVGQYQIITTPEPSTWMLLSLGAAILVLRRLRPNLRLRGASQRK